MADGLGADGKWLFGVLKRAAERYELRTLSADAQVKPSALAMLDPHVGTWQGRMSTWLLPGAPYDVQDVSSVARWTLGGKFLERTFEGRFLGRPFEAICLTGHDDAADQYVAGWLDSATTAMVPLRGVHDAATQTLTLQGTLRLEREIDVTLDIRTVLTMEDANHLRHEILLGKLGVYFKAHEIDLVRVTSPA